MPIPPFAEGRRWNRRASRSRREVGRRVWHDMDDGFEYERCSKWARSWHRIDWRQGYSQDIDPATGEPLPGAEGHWRPLK